MNYNQSPKIYQDIEFKSFTIKILNFDNLQSNCTEFQRFLTKRTEGYLTDFAKIVFKGSNETRDFFITHLSKIMFSHLN